MTDRDKTLTDRDKSLSGRDNGQRWKATLKGNGKKRCKSGITLSDGDKTLSDRHKSLSDRNKTLSDRNIVRQK